MKFRVDYINELTPMLEGGKSIEISVSMSEYQVENLLSELCESRGALFILKNILRGIPEAELEGLIAKNGAQE